MRGTSIIEGFIKFSNKDIDNAKYKIGDFVDYKHPECCGSGEVLAVSDTGDGIEYAVGGMPFLLWESEILNVQ